MPGTVVYFDTYRKELQLTPRHAEPPPESPFRSCDGGLERVLNERQLTHRRRMLDHLARALTSRSA